MTSKDQLKSIESSYSGVAGADEVRRTSSQTYSLSNNALGEEFLKQPNRLSAVVDQVSVSTQETANKVFSDMFLTGAKPHSGNPFEISGQDAQY